MAIKDNFLTIQEKVGKKLQIYNDTDGWLDSRPTDVTQDDLKELINDAYINKYFVDLQSKYPQLYTKVALTDSWIATGTGDAGLTGSTFVATTSIFSSGMVGLRIYNETDGEYADIEGYTSGTTVTLSLDDVSGWSGDTVYVLGKQFAFAGNATDVFALRRVGIKYNTTVTEYVYAEPRIKEDFKEFGSEETSEDFPFFYDSAFNVSGTQTLGVEIEPRFKKKVSNGLLIEYIEAPGELSADGDIPVVPNTLPLIYAATSMAFEYRDGQDSPEAFAAESRYQQLLKDLESQLVRNRNTKIRAKKSIYDMLTRRI